MRRCWLQNALFAVVVYLIPVGVRGQEPVTGAPAFHGFLFGDVTYIATQREIPEGFLIGQLVGHGNARLSPRLSLFGEMSATAREAGYNVEVERIILRYDFADELKLSVGRYHTPVSYWNTAYHHGLWLQTSVARPELIKMGGVFLPVHFVGMLAEGQVGARAFSLSYGAGLGNGRAATITRGGDAGDVNSSRAAVVRVAVSPTALFGLTLGGSLYLDDAMTTNGPVDERTTSAHIVWSQGAPELIAEYVHIRHEQDFAVPSSTTSTGYYVHGGVKLGAFKPYARIEEMSIAAGDQVFASVPNYSARLVGLRWDFEGLAAVKTELRRERFAARDAEQSVLVQLTFVLPSFMAM